MSSHSLVLLEDPLSPSGGYVTSYPPQHLMQMRSFRAKCAWFPLNADEILLVCGQEGSARSFMHSPTTMRFDTYCYL